MEQPKIKYNIAVIGSGGTGTYFLKEFSRFIAGGNPNIGSLYIFDGDVIEDKNLARQAFTKEDVGFNKASVMADVLSSAFSLNWRAFATYLTEIDQLKNLSNNTGSIMYIPLIVGCVDNHACRMLLEDYFNANDNVIYYDSANEFSTGEVIFSYKLNGKVLSPTRSHYFPQIKNADLRSVTEMSCEELNNVAPQHIATNMCAGNILLKEITSMLSGKPNPGMVTFDTDTYYQEFVPYSDKEDVA
ncbi:ThiF family adenylyltransferase [Butyrivibrio hungatei]|uniref:ThiF family protein n=1 Tax=Butyrivibrio hungatei TaxID=185008 RepID=A0A1D9P5N9_9FIRM|nr:ThiF family adenylyltransferase [Butyrivibrio hungatei]AOZ97859.1 ThiF family protein [Butyrivibrio hungatei]